MAAAAAAVVVRRTLVVLDNHLHTDPDPEMEEQGHQDTLKKQVGNLIPRGVGMGGIRDGPALLRLGVDTLPPGDAGILVDTAALVKSMVDIAQVAVADDGKVAVVKENADTAVAYCCCVAVGTVNLMVGRGNWVWRRRCMDRWVEVDRYIDHWLEVEDRWRMGVGVAGHSSWAAGHCIARVKACFEEVDRIGRGHRSYGTSDLQGGLVDGAGLVMMCCSLLLTMMEVLDQLGCRPLVVLDRCSLHCSSRDRWNNRSLYFAEN